MNQNSTRSNIGNRGIELEIDNLSQLGEFAKSNCKKCYGRGYKYLLQANNSDGELMPVLCNCLDIERLKNNAKSEES